MSWYDYIIPQVALSKWLYHRAVPDAPQQPQTTGEVLPAVAEGTPLLLVYGRCRVRTPILVWSGNAFTVGTHYTGGFGATVADHASIDLLFVLGSTFGNGLATLTQIRAGDALASLAYGAVTPSVQRFNWNRAPPSTSDLVIDGVFLGGTTDQNVNRTGLSAISPDTGTFHDGVNYASTGGSTYRAVAVYSGTTLAQIPGYRNQMVAFMHVGLGLQPQIPAFSFEVLSLSTGTPVDLGHSLANDADPAAVILDILITQWNRCGLPISSVDLDSFKAASATLFTEGNGYSRCIESGTDARSIVLEILKQINGVLFVDPVTSLITLRLIRKDYDISTLDDINPDNCDAPAPGWLSVSGWAEQPNQVKVTYTNRADNYAQAVKNAQNQAGIQVGGGRLRSLSVSYPGCCTDTLAAKLAARDLNEASRPLVKATVKVDQRFRNKRIGDVVTLTWPEENISLMPMRITRVNRGKPGASRITLDLMHDVFDAPTGAFP